MSIDDDIGNITKKAGQVAGAVQAGVEIANQVVGALNRLMGERIEIVRYHFSALDGPDPSWHVRRFHLTEGLSQTYEITLDLLTEELETDSDELLGAQAEFTLERGELYRAVYGIIHRVDYVGITGGRLMVRVYVVPALRLLSQTIRTRFFQGRTVPDILNEVLGPALEAFGRTFSLDDCHLAGEYERRDYCVQYRESDLDFCCRLMEEEGIAYLFEADADAHVEKLVLIDNNNDYGEVEVLMDDDLPIITDRPDEADRESLRFFDLDQVQQLNKVSTAGWNWKVNAKDEAQQEYEDAHHHRVRELYLHDDRRQIVDDPVEDPDASQGFTGEGLAQRGPMALRRKELLVRGTKRGQGRSNATAFAAGLRFKVAEHTREDIDQKKFILTRVIHSGDAPEQELGESAGGGPRYDNSFECIPEEHAFRPAVVTPKPRTFGPQTAIVVGPPEGQGDSAQQVEASIGRVHTDPHGRIKARFHWDRETPQDDTSSCWVRVAQSWAGPQYGVLFIPRVGMEVVVDFLDGNPDRPLVVGCVYNGSNPPPYELPGAKTKSTIKTTSSEGGEGFNELRFEDATGAEEIFLHAQKDFNEKVLNNHSTTVMADQSNTVKGSQTESVTGSQSMTVTGKRTKHVKKTETNTVDQKRHTKLNADDVLKTVGLTDQTLVGGYKQKVTQFAKLTISDLYQIDVTGTQKITVNGKSSLSVSNSHDAVAKNHYAIAQGKEASLVLEAKSATMAAVSKISIGAGESNAVITMANDGKLSVNATTSITLAVGGSSVTIDSKGIAVAGPKVGLVGGKGGAVTLDASAAVVGGPEVKSIADGNNILAGALVKIN